MTLDAGPLPLDARLLSQTVIELNIARRTVALYPQGHPAVERSLNRAHEFLTRLFELRPEITLGVAKDTLVVDAAALDRRNPVFREFALHLNRLGIASLSFRERLSREELSGFCRVLVAGAALRPGPEVGRLLDEEGVTHLNLGFISYADFAFQEGATRLGESGQNIWERYVRALVDQALGPGEGAPEIQDVPPRVLARFVNERPPEILKEQSYDRVISAYVRSSSERRFSGRGLGKVLDFVEALNPALKRQFLSSAVNLVSSDIEATEQALRGMEVERVVELLSAINEQRLVIPEALRILITSLAKIADALPEDRTYAGRVIADDHAIAPEVSELLGSGGFSSFVTASYQEELDRLLLFDAASVVSDESAGLRRECAIDRIEQDFAALLGELVCSDIVPEEDYHSLVDLMLQEAEGHLTTGRYEEVSRALDLLELNRVQGRFPEAAAEGFGRLHAPEFLRRLADSLVIFGRLHREEARSLCGRYGEELVPWLVDALIAERSQAVRRYLASLIAGYGGRAAPELLKRLNDSRWYVQRNMIFLLGQCEPANAAVSVRLFSRSANPKVSIEAIRYLLRAGDASGVEPLLEQLRGQKRENVERAVALTGALRVREAVPQLLHLLAGKAIGGADLLGRIPIVKALGEIGDERAVPALRELAGTRSLIFRGAYERLREEVFLSLRRYPFAAVSNLVEEGARSHTARVRAECQRILEANRG